MTGSAAGRLLAVLRSPWLRGAFLLVAVALAVYAVVAVRDEVVAAASSISAARVALALVLSVAFVGCTFLAWRAVLADVGARVRTGPALSVFGLGQLGKYVPGGVWNVVASAELGADYGIPRRRSVTAMAVATLVGVVSGAVVGLVALPFLAAGALGTWDPWSWVLLPVAVVVLLPPVVNRLVAGALLVARRPSLERPLGWRGLGAATAWSVAGWVCAGLQVWVLAAGLGMPTTARTVALAVGGYALAWVVGFLVVVVPAGAGARELVLVAVLGGTLPHGALLLVVLTSRVLVTLVDLLMAGAGVLAARGARQAAGGR